MLTQQSIRAAFASPIVPVPEPLHYRIALAAVAIALILLPAIYLALIALTAWGWYLYLTVGLSALGRINFITLAPVVIGPVLILFLLKPLLARSAKPSEPLTLRRDQAPLLFELVDRLCDNVGAPRPSRIDADVQVNASASLRRGALSLFTRDLVLTIGLPLVQNLTLREFTSVLAHEFGHFRQGAGMALTYIIRSISFWFARVVFERDAWDARLNAFADEGGRLSLIAHAARFFVWLSRKVLHGLMLVANALTGFLTRQMEFDADQVAVRIAGHDAFAATMRRLPALDLAGAWAHSDLAQSWNKGRLADDFPALLASNLVQLPADRIQDAVDDAMDGHASMYASHPPTSQRIARAEATPTPGVPGLDGAATDLFDDFPATCREASLHSYRLWIGDHIDPSHLIASSQVAADAQQSQVHSQARERVFQNWFDGPVHFHLPASDPAGEDQPEAANESLRHASEAYDRIVRNVQLSALARAGLTFDPARFNVNSSQPNDLDSDAASARAAYHQSAALLRQSTPTLARRISRARDAAPEAALRLAAFERIERPFLALHESVRITEALLGQLESQAGNEQLAAVTAAQGPSVYRALEAIEEALGPDAPLFAWTPIHRDPEDDLATAMNLAAQAINRLSTGYISALGELAVAAESEPRPLY